MSAPARPVVARRAESRADRLAVIEVSHRATAPDQPWERYAARRLAHPRRAAAAWWLLEEDGRAVSSLLCHPLRFGAADATFDGYGIGAVATRPDARRRGHAAALCRAAIEAEEARGRTTGLLFSAVPPAMYERLGFRTAPAWEPSCERLEDLAASGPRAEWVPLDPRAEADALVRLYRRHHEGLRIERDRAGWARSLELNPTDEFLGVGDPPRAYARMSFEPEGAEVVECVGDSADRSAMLRAAADLVRRTGGRRVVGWFRPPPEVEPFFTDRGRAKTLPMVRGYPNLESARFWSSDYF